MLNCPLMMHNCHRIINCLFFKYLQNSKLEHELSSEKSVFGGHYEPSPVSITLRSRDPQVTSGRLAFLRRNREDCWLGQRCQSRKDGCPCAIPDCLPIALSKMTRKTRLQRNFFAANRSFSQS